LSECSYYYFLRTIAASCSAGSNANASWPSIPVASSAVFNCSAGYFAYNSTAVCTWNGVSSTWDKNPCQAVYCAAGETDSVSWSKTLAGTFSPFSCREGHFSSTPCASVFCVQSGGSADWATYPTCQGYCFYHNFYCGRVFENWHTVSFCSRLPRDLRDGSSWNTTAPNTIATGQCHPGFVSDSNSNPQRLCNPNGTWGEIEDECVDSPLGQAADWLPFVISGVVGAASVITYFFARKRNPDAQNYLILGTGFSLVELFTDCLFLLQTSMLIGSFDFIPFFLLLVMFMALMPLFFR